MQELHAHEGRPYRPEALMRPEDVVTMLLAALADGPGAEVTDISIRPLAKLPPVRALVDRRSGARARGEALRSRSCVASPSQVSGQ